ncbi:MAG TPA: lysophospholipid acyltransferase family protein [Anaeromyxobacter sp.]|nr:lysophospholipid acyltransferase family protein [Anaeromyxobacter sp.]
MSALRLVGSALPVAARAGHRIAGTGAVAAAAAARLGALRRRDARAGRRERARLLRDLLARLTALHGIEVAVEGRRLWGPVLLASNHVSWLDPVVLGGLVPCVPISKLDVSSWPVVGPLARELGVLFVDRGDGHSGMAVMRGAVRALEDGVAVLNFPEGTTTRGDRVLPFRTGLFSAARSRGAEVVPVAIAYDPPELAWVGDDAFVPHYLRLAGRRRVRVTVRFGAPVAARDTASGAELAAVARGRVEALLRGPDAAAAGV